MTYYDQQRDAGARAAFVQRRSEAEQVPCPEPGCAAPIGVTCQNLRGDGLLFKLPAHHKRMQKARG